MARREIIVLQDDLDGAEDASVKTVRFGVDNHVWEIDLTTVHKDELLAALAPYITAGRPFKETSRAKPKHITKGEQKRRNTACRAWHEAKGHPINKRGRISPAHYKAWEMAGASFGPFDAATPKAATTVPHQPSRRVEPSPRADMLEVAAARNGGRPGTKAANRTPVPQANFEPAASKALVDKQRAQAKGKTPV